MPGVQNLVNGEPLSCTNEIDIFVYFSYERNDKYSVFSSFNINRSNKFYILVYTLSATCTRFYTFTPLCRFTFNMNKMISFLGYTVYTFWFNIYCNTRRFLHTFNVNKLLLFLVIQSILRFQRLHAILVIFPYFCYERISIFLGYTVHFPSPTFIMNK